MALTRTRPEVANSDAYQMRLYLFTHTLTGKVKTWWWSDIPKGTVRTWGQLKVLFMKKFYTSARTHKYTQAISNFRQEPDESLATTYERFKELLRKCPHHGMTEAALVRFFYQGLSRCMVTTLILWVEETFLIELHEHAGCWFREP